jgi:hypothetical protein
MRNLNRFNLCAECPDFLTRRLFDQREVLVDHGFFDLAPARSVPSVMPPWIKARGIEATSEVGNYSRKFIPVVTAGIAAIPMRNHNSVELQSRRVEILVRLPSRTRTESRNLSTELVLREAKILDLRSAAHI